MEGMLGDSLRRRRGGRRRGAEAGSGAGRPGAGGDGPPGGGSGNGPGGPVRPGGGGGGGGRPVRWWRWIGVGLLGAAAALGIGYALAAWVIFPAPPDSGEQIQVPSLIGLSLDSARHVLAARRLQLGDTMLIASDSAQGTIIAQSTLAEQDLLPGGRVNVAVALPRRTVTVPPVVGLGQAAAQALLTELGLSADPQVIPDSVPAGRVLDVQPAVGATVQPPGPVVLTVSGGPASLDTTLIGADSGVVAPTDTGAPSPAAGGVLPPAERPDTGKAPARARRTGGAAADTSTGAAGAGGQSGARRPEHAGLGPAGEVRG